MRAGLRRPAEPRPRVERVRRRASGYNHAMVRTPRLCLVILIATSTLAGLGCQKRVVSETPYGVGNGGGFGAGDRGGFRPLPVEYQKPPEEPFKLSDIPNPFKMIGDGVANIMPDGKRKTRHLTPGQGDDNKGNSGFSGTKEFRGNDGKLYQLEYKKGELSGVHPATTVPPANRLPQ